MTKTNRRRQRETLTVLAVNYAEAFEEFVAQKKLLYVMSVRMSVYEGALQDIADTGCVMAEKKAREALALAAATM